VSRGEAKRLETRYLAELQRAISRNRYYPKKARRNKLEGKVTVTFVLRKDGRLTSIGLARGSGHSALDEAALQTLRRLGRFKPIPDAIGRSQWKLRIPINYALR
jgi:protein TonB